MEEKASFSENRQHPRIPLDLDIEVMPLDLEIEVSQVLSDDMRCIEGSVRCKCRDISGGGISFYSMNSYPLHSLLRLYILLEGINIKVMGKVIWVKQLPASTTFMMGVQFLNIYEDDYNMLCSYIKAKYL